jgi:hypothetical protein
MSRRLRAFGWMTFWLIALVGCSSWSSVPPISQPYFVVNQTDVRSFHVLAKKQDALVAKCAEHESCDHVYFTRALIGLYESRETARKYFEKVIAIAPKGQLAGSSRLWLQLLQEYPAPNERSWIASVMTAPAISDGQVMLGQTSDRLVRDLLDREMMIQQMRTIKEADARAIDQLQRDLAEQERKFDSLTGKRDQVKVPAESVTVQSLQKQLSERDKKIDELSSQLEALKRIDQEMRDKVRPLRPPSTVAPPSAPEPANP